VRSMPGVFPSCSIISSLQGVYEEKELKLIITLNRQLNDSGKMTFSCVTN